MGRGSRGTVHEEAQNPSYGEEGASNPWEEVRGAVSYSEASYWPREVN